MKKNVIGIHELNLCCLAYRNATEAIFQYNVWDLTFKALERLKELSESRCRQLLMVLGSHLDTDLQVLADVG